MKDKRMRPESVILYCQNEQCGVGYGSVGETPAICPACRRPTIWTLTPPKNAVPTVPWALSFGDKRFLKMRGIVAE